MLSRFDHRSGRGRAQLVSLSAVLTDEEVEGLQVKVEQVPVEHLLPPSGVSRC